MTRWAFLGLVAVVAALRLGELAVAERHRRRLVARGAREVGARHYPWMVALHTGWLVAGPAEVWLAGRAFRPALAAGMLLVLGLATALRWWVVSTLGERWTTRVLVLPGAPLVTGGPFRWLRHPNYLGVAAEVPALPLVHGAWLTAAVFGLANLLLLRTRIRVEEAALAGAT